MITINPCDNITLPKATRKERETWTPEQVKTFLHWDEPKESKYFTMLLISFYTGMRPGEEVGLKWNDFHDNAFYITQGLDRKKRATGLKTEGSHRTVFINKNIGDALLEQRRWQTENKILFGDKYTNSDYMFTHENDSCITPQQLYIHFKRLIKRCNTELKIMLPIISLYGARHSFGTNAMEAGAEVSALSKLNALLETLARLIESKATTIEEAAQIVREAKS